MHVIILLTCKQLIFFLVQILMSELFEFLGFKNFFFLGGGFSRNSISADLSYVRFHFLEVHVLGFPEHCVLVQLEYFDSVHAQFNRNDIRLGSLDHLVKIN